MTSTEFVDTRLNFPLVDVSSQVFMLSPHFTNKQFHKRIFWQNQYYYNIYLVL